MKCSKCGTEVASNSATCKRCGTPVAGKAAATAIPEEYDLMPLEEKKSAVDEQFQPPPMPDPAVPPPTKQVARMKGIPTGSDGPPPLDPNYRPPSEDQGPPESKLMLYAGLAVAAAFILFIGWRMFRTKNELIVGQTKAKMETTVVLQPGMTKVENYEATGSISYTFDVNVTDGDVMVGVVQRQHKLPTTLVEIKKLPDAFDSLKKGDTKTYTGDFKHKEQWSWVIYNDTKKPARVKVKFTAG